MSENFIRTYDDLISPEVCQQIISAFEMNPDQHEDVVFGNHRSFKQINLQQHDDTWKPFSEMLQKVFYDSIGVYMRDCDIQRRMFPEEFAFENFRLKRYLPNESDHFDDHVDVGNYDSARRFLVFFLYLDDNLGGHTDFPQFDISVQPKAGRMVMFPPMWTHLHAGRKPIDKPKYIIGSYLHYV